MSHNYLTGVGKYIAPSWMEQANAADSSASPRARASQAAAPNSAPDQVSLSDAAKALQAQDAGSANTANAANAQPAPGAADFAQEQQLLTTLADKSLAAMGIVSTADEANTKISFDSLSYAVSSSVTASISQQGQQSSTQVSASQDETFTGEGHIVTPDGQNFTFQIKLELDQSAQVSETSDSGNANATPTANSNNVDSTTQQQPSNLSAQLLNALGQASNSSNVPGQNSNTDNSSGSGDATTPNSVANQAAQPASASTLINWDAILQQTKGISDLLDSLASLSSPGAHQQTPLKAAT